MDEEREEERFKPEPEGKGPARHTGWLTAAVFLVILTGVAFVYALNERGRARRLAQNDQRMERTLQDARKQIASLSTRVNELNAEHTVPPLRPSPVAHRNETAARARRHRAARHADDPRWNRVQAELARHQQEIDATHQQLDKNRTDMESELSSTRDNLNGSIARNAGQLAELQKKSQRRFYQYDLHKSKDLQRLGPIGIALRKANAKHAYCDLKLLVDDRVITKKHVNLYEPVLFYPDGYAQPLELVVYKIGKKEASGYVSVPRFTENELRASSNSPAVPESQRPHNGATPAVSLQHRPGVPVN